MCVYTAIIHFKIVLLQGVLICVYFCLCVKKCSQLIVYFLRVEETFTLHVFVFVLENMSAGTHKIFEINVVMKMNNGL